ncbi:hypothetical protein DL771_005897 [Monosporascus sp. 5C6A]|nr:hypothetical protein DL771_005897 [Monosporascus sp. 5C6A]
MTSTLRRRVLDGGADDTPSDSSTPTTPTLAPTVHDDSPAKPGEKVRIIHHRHPPKTRRRRNTFIFLLGSLFGLIAAGFLAQSNDLIELPEIGELSMDSLLDVLPAGLAKDMRDFVIGEREAATAYNSFAVGVKARSEGLGAHHPIIMIPGVISTGLESWGTANISRPYFRRRLWGSWSMMRALVLDKESWKKHLMLDKVTGLDPPDVKLRAAQGFDATDFFITGYWIWNKIIENLASLGYDPTNSFTAAYDWRLSYQNLEVRDQYFSRLKAHIEMAHQFSNKKVVLASHSMGSQVLFYFLHWVASGKGGKGGDDWVEKHVEAWINISGCMLGAVKGVTAILSGEMRDTAQLNAFAVSALERFLSKDERAELFRAMPGISSMLPIGGDLVWGNMTWAPDDQPGQSHTFGSFLNFRTGLNRTTPDTNLTMDNTLDYLLQTTDDWYRDQLERSYSRGVAHTTAEVEANELDPRKWVNPLETRLPLAPSLKIYCFYGVGKPTERAYYYRSPEFPGLTTLNITIDTGHTTAPGGAVDHGVIMGEGDGTVNLLSSGYMCARGWRMRRYNPAGARVVAVEMRHEPDRFNPRGGPNTADHVDILGRQTLNELILRVAAGRGDLIQEHIVSNIHEYADRVKIYEEEAEGHKGESTSESMDSSGKRKEPPAGGPSAPSVKKSKGGNAGKWKTPHHKAKLDALKGRMIEAGDVGVWVTCMRGKERQAISEFVDICNEYGEKLYGIKPPADDPASDGEEDGDIESSIRKEIDGMKSSDKPRDLTFEPVRVNVDCVFFMRTKQPVDPTKLVEAICKDAKNCTDRKQRRSRFVNRLTPVSIIGKATASGVEEVAKVVLAKHFQLAGDGKNEEPKQEESGAHSYAIRPHLRAHNTLKRDDVINKVASLIAPCHKTFCGMSVVGSDWDAMKRFNVYELYESAPKSTGDASAGPKE